MPDAVLTALKKAAKGLLVPSESDAPFTPFRWPQARGEISGDKVAALARRRRIPRSKRYRWMISSRSWRTPTTRSASGSCARSSSSSSRTVKVFRIGEVKVDVYLVGKSAGGDWAGLKTTSVET